MAFIILFYLGYTHFILMVFRQLNLKIVSRNFFLLPLAYLGSYLAPLFLIFKNSHILIFVDDLKIFKAISSYNDSLHLQEDLTTLSKWCNNNNLALNIKKCKFVTFTQSRSPVTSTSLLIMSIFKNELLSMI